MKKNLKSIIAVLALIIAGSMNAQDSYDKGFRLGFGANVGYAFDDAYALTLGGDVRLQYDLSQKTSLTLTTGFTNLFKDEAGKDLGFIPVKAGFKGFVFEDSFYLLGEIGAGFAVTNGSDQTTLILAPGVGYANKYIDLSVRYEHYNNFLKANGSEGFGQLALRVAYGFKL